MDARISGCHQPYQPINTGMLHHHPRISSFLGLHLLATPIPISYPNLQKIPGTPRPPVYKWLFQLDDSQSLYRKWLEITISIHFLMVGNGVPGTHQSLRKIQTHPFLHEGVFLTGHIYIYHIIPEILFSRIIFSERNGGCFSKSFPFKKKKRISESLPGCFFSKTSPSNIGIDHFQIGLLT